MTVLVIIYLTVHLLEPQAGSWSFHKLLTPNIMTAIKQLLLPLQKSSPETRRSDHSENSEAHFDGSL